MIREFSSNNKKSEQSIGIYQKTQQRREYPDNNTW